MIFDIENIICNKCKNKIFIVNQRNLYIPNYTEYSCELKCSEFYSEYNYFYIFIEAFSFQKFKKGVRVFKTTKTPVDLDFELFEISIQNKYKNISNYRFVSQLHFDLINTINLFKENLIFI